MSRSSSFLLSNPSNQNTFKPFSVDGEFLKSKEFVGSDFFHNNQQQNHHNFKLARYQSAPSSFLAALLDSNTDNSSSGDESEAFFSGLMDGPKNSDNQMDYITKQEATVDVEPPLVFQNEQMSGFESVVNAVGGAVVESYSVGMENQLRLSNGSGNTNYSSLVRHSSSPAGFFNGFGVMGEVGNYRLQNHAEVSSSAGGLSRHVNLSSVPSCSSRFMPSIPENGNGSIDTCISRNNRLRNDGDAKGRELKATFRHDCWNESPFNGLKTFSNINGLENQNGETRKKSPGLVSHLSLPKTSAEMVVAENLLQFQPETTVPCQVRAKRGCATHPRSIAERMRRSRISKNLKKLQDLFPNMDKQTNTADMLDIAVEYIKNLQKQVQALTGSKSKCVCSSNP